MDDGNYFSEVSRKINSMIDEEFMNMLKEVGLEKCPVIEEDADSDINELMEEYYEEYNQELLEGAEESVNLGWEAEQLEMKRNKKGLKATAEDILNTKLEPREVNKISNGEFDYYMRERFNENEVRTTGYLASNLVNKLNESK